MPENPLLPNAKLQELYAHMSRTRAVSQQAKSGPPLEALLSAMLLHIEAKDFVSLPPQLAAAAGFAAERTTGTPAPAPKRGAVATTAAPEALSPGQRLTAAAGVAQGLRLAGSDRLALCLTETGAGSARTAAGWAEVLRFAQQRGDLPLLLACMDVGGSPKAAPAGALTWPAMSRITAALRLPVLTVDGTDAVAVYRVMQESVLRLRAGGGAAVVWCLLPRRAEAGDDPLAKLRQYMRVRKIPLKTR